MSKEMLSTKDVAEYLNINEKQVYKLIKERKIPATRMTGKWTFPKRLIDEWIIKSAKETVEGNKTTSVPEDHIVVMGSNDFSLEILSRELSRVYPQFNMFVSNVGSVGGLVALDRGICHMASCHLLDPETGKYNLSCLSRYLPELEVSIINLVYRDLGLLIARGNPMGIAGIEDLSRPGITFINRQQGSGTRIFLDFELKRLGIDAQKVNGYENQVNTHSDVAIAVLSGSAGAGLGILPAAKMLGLEFIHLTKERYDLIIPDRIISSSPIKKMLQVIRSEEFKKMVNQMEGYDTTRTGQTINT